MANNEKNWLQRIWGWIKRWSKRRQKQATAHPTILKSWYGENCAVLQLRRQTRGAIATYRIIPKANSDSWLLCWDDLRERHTEALGQYGGKALKLRPSENIAGHTHGFSVWRIPKGSSVPYLVGAWNIRLESSTSYAARRRKKLGLRPFSLLIAESVALHLKDMQLVGTWQERMSQMDWANLVVLYGLNYFPNFDAKDCLKVG